MEITNSREKVNSNETIHPIIGKGQWDVMNYLVNTDNNEPGSSDNGIHIIDNNISPLNGNLGIDSSGSSSENSLGLSPKRSKCILNDDICIVESIDNNNNNNNNDSNNSMLNSAIKWNNSINSQNSDNNQIITPPPTNHSYHKYNSINGSSTISTTPSKNIQKDGLDIDLDLDVEIDVDEVDENDINNNDNEDIEVDYDGSDHNSVKRDSLFNSKQGIFFIKKNNTGNTGINQHQNTSKNINNGSECFDNNNSNGGNNSSNGSSQPNDQYKSGYKGVSWNKRMQSWLAFWTEGQRRRSKTFNSKIYGFDVARSEAIAFLKAKQSELQSMGQLHGKKSMHYLRQNIDNSIPSLKTINGIYLHGNKYNVINNQNNELLCDINNTKDSNENKTNLLENEIKSNIENIRNRNIKNGIHPLINGQDFIQNIENKNILNQKSLFSTYGYNDNNCNIVEKLGLTRINYPNILYDENIIQNNKVPTTAIGQYYTLQDLKGVSSVSNLQLYNTTSNNGNSNSMGKCVVKNDNNNSVNNKVISSISRNVNNKIEKYDDNVNLTHGLFKTNKNISTGNVINNNDNIMLNGNNSLINLNSGGGIMGNMILMNNNNGSSNNHNRNVGTNYKNHDANNVMSSSQQSTNMEGNKTNKAAKSLLQIALNTINDNNIKMNELINNNQEKISNNGVKNDENEICGYNTKMNINLSNNKINHANIVNYCGDINRDIKNVMNAVSSIRNDNQSIINNENNECWSNIFQYNNLVNNSVNYNLMNATNCNGCNSNKLQSELGNINANFLNAINVLDSGNNNISNDNKSNEVNSSNSNTK
ncbi:hypothetical protein RS030_111886 [Cryptosporidium xiaoi]|uniref:AP2/ERF domain-containing protein n=1 Tax=Cryptosporidium xiaoi TaxID=659607 RepID=A0AAV9YB36_9CRYT